MNMKCDYCGKTKEKMSFYIGASLGNDNEWTMWEGTGKMSCGDPKCHAKGKAESKQAVDRHVASVGRNAAPRKRPTRLEKLLAEVRVR